MKLCIISDSHNKHEQIIIPKCDILIHCGDFSNKGSLLELYSFAAWMEKQSANYMISVAGNHDHCFQNSNALEARETMKQFGITYLQDSGVEINGLHIFGQPWQPFFYDWSFNVHRGTEIAKKWSLIPDEVDVLITHGPPHGILDLVEDEYMSDRDRHQGCEELRKKVDQLTNLKLHVFGHLHHQGGNIINLNNKIFANAAMCDDHHNLLRQALIIDI